MHCTVHLGEGECAPQREITLLTPGYIQSYLFTGFARTQVRSRASVYATVRNFCSFYD